MKKIISTVLFLTFAGIIYVNLVGFEDGIVGFTRKNDNPIGCICHRFEPDTRVFVKIEGPTDVVVNDTVTYKLKVSQGPAVAAGCDISTNLGTVTTSPLDTALQSLEEFPGAGFEVTHRYPKLFTSDTLEFIFRYIAPSTSEVIDTIFANANSVNHDSTSSNDRWNYADNFLINIIDEPLPVELASFTSSVNANSVTLSWSTASEINNQGFEIERSDITCNWVKAGYVNGNGNSTVNNSYTFTDGNLNTGKYMYRLKQIDFNGHYEYFNLTNEVNIGVPVSLELSQNYPNPFNPATRINYQVPADGNVSVKIYDMSGREAAVLINEYKTAGYYSVNFNAGNMPSGTYFYRISSNGNSVTKKMLLVK